MVGHQAVIEMAVSGAAVVAGVAAGSLVVGRLPSFSFADVAYAVAGAILAGFALSRDSGSMVHKAIFSAIAGVGVGLALPVLARIPMVASVGA